MKIVLLFLSVSAISLGAQADRNIGEARFNKIAAILKGAAIKEIDSADHGVEVKVEKSTGQSVGGEVVSALLKTLPYSEDDMAHGMLSTTDQTLRSGSWAVCREIYLQLMNLIENSTTRRMLMNEGKYDKNFAFDQCIRIQSNAENQQIRDVYIFTRGFHESEKGTKLLIVDRWGGA